MKYLKGILAASAVRACSLANASALTAKADSLELLAYSNRDGGGGLHLAWRANPGDQWQPIGGGMSFVNSDFGPWGSHKTMFMPTLIHNADGTWTATWIADKEGRVTATVTSPDLIYWHAQNYTDRKADEKASTTYYINGRMVDGSVVKAPAAEV